jgi:hypothetical protein
MFISKVALPRRTFLRGVGVTLALPLLDAMIPALTATAKTAATPVPRLGFFYVPNGMSMPYWRPKTVGADFEFSPTLAPLLPHRQYVTVVSGLSNYSAYLGGLGVHTRPCAAWLSGARAQATEGSDLRLGTTADQIAARVLGKDTVLESLELSTDAAERVGNCENGYSCLYLSTISWRAPTVPNPMEVNPRVVFERLFGEDATEEARMHRLQMDKSILDQVTQELTGFQRQIGADDRHMLDDYLEAVRSVERRIQKSEKHAVTEIALERPIGLPETFDEHVKLMSDLLVLAYQADLTRVVTFVIARELSANTYPAIGVPEQHHEVSHHQGNPEKLRQLGKLNAYHMTLFARLVDKLAQTRDGDGTLLDHSLLLYGAAMSDPNLHSPLDLPLVLVGGGGGTLKGNRHLKYPDDQKVSMANLLQTILDKAGVPGDHIGDGTGVLSDL